MKRQAWIGRTLLAASCAVVLGLGAVGTASAADAAPAINVGGIDKGGGSIKGTVKFAGEQRARKPIATDADPYCANLHKTEPLEDERYVWGDNGTLQNVFVWVSKGLEGKTFPSPEAKAQIMQNGCSYHPHVQGVLVGQELKILNDDNTLHNVQVAPKINGTFNEAMPVKGMTLTKKFTKAEMPIQFKCAVHPWMTAYVMVMENPFFAVTQKDGTFEIKGLPAGEYELSFWHEYTRFVPDQAKVTVKVEEGKAAEVTVTYAPAKKAS